MFTPSYRTYREGAVYPLHARLYSLVFSLLQKPVNVRVKLQTISGSQFQIKGPEVAKLRNAYRARRLC